MKKKENSDETSTKESAPPKSPSLNEQAIKLWFVVQKQASKRGAY